MKSCKHKKVGSKKLSLPNINDKTMRDRLLEWSKNDIEVLNVCFLERV